MNKSMIMACQIVIEKGPTRVLINREGEAVAPRRAADIKPDVIFVRDDGWSLGTISAWEDVAENLWKDQWQYVIRRMPVPTNKGMEGAWEAQKYTPSNNCLADIVCPECGSGEPFEITATSTFLVYDSGTDEHSDVEWNDDSPIFCRACGHRGTIKEFRLTTEVLRSK